MSSNTGGTLPPPMRARLTRELSRLQNDPPPGIAAYAPKPSDPSHLRAQITGPPDGPYATGIFLVTIRFTSRYPFEPPRVRFVTPVHHPNVDSAGRICLDTLKSPPAGSWSPAVSLPSLLTTLRTLLSDPNPDDALVPEIADVYKSQPKRFEEEARRITQREATAERVAALETELDGNAASASGNGGRDAGKKEADAPIAAADPAATITVGTKGGERAVNGQEQQDRKKETVAEAAAAAGEPNPAEESEDNFADDGEKKRPACGEKEEGRGGKRQRVDPGNDHTGTAEEISSTGAPTAAATAATATSALEQ